MNKCPKCGFSSEELFCEECGTEMIPVVESVENEESKVKTESTSKISKCPKCGYKGVTKFCPECGNVMEVVEINASNSDSPVQQDEEATAQETDIKSTEKIPNESKGFLKTKKGKIIIAVIAVVLIVAVALIVKSASASSYEDNLNLLASEVISGGADAEELGNLAMSVWYDAIWENTNESDTKQYVNGAKDFNEALSNMYSSDEIKKKVSDIELNQKLCETIMNDLKNPPSKYQSQYKLAVELYSAYKEFTDLAINPTGSYKSFSEKFEDLDSKVSNLYNQYKAVLP